MEQSAFLHFFRICFYIWIIKQHSNLWSILVNKYFITKNVLGSPFTYGKGFYKFLLSWHVVVCTKSFCYIFYNNSPLTYHFIKCSWNSSFSLAYKCVIYWKVSVLFTKIIVFPLNFVFHKVNILRIQVFF